MYNDLIKNNSSNLKIECDERLLKIFKRSFDNDIFFPYGHYSASKKSVKQFDNILYAGSLTKHFRKNEKDFTTKPYIETLGDLDNKFKLILSNFKDKKMIGISWKSVFNIFGGLAFTLIQVGTLIDGAFTMHYLFFSIVEISTTIYIAWTAWNWNVPN